MITENIRNLLQSETSLSFFTLKEIQKHLYYNDKSPSLSWVHTSLKKARISRRRFNNTFKVCTRQQSEMKDLLKTFKDKIDILRDDEIVCIDETGFCNIGNNFYGYFPKGKQPSTVHVRKRERVSLVMAINPSIGVITYKAQEKPFNTISFYEFIKDNVIPSIPKQTKAILLDNVSFHKSKKIVDLLQEYNIIPLFIPPYSPRCNPIEEVFSILKRNFRRAYISDNFQDAILESLKKLKQYKDIAHHYNHTRCFLEANT